MLEIFPKTKERSVKLMMIAQTKIAQLMQSALVVGTPKRQSIVIYSLVMMSGLQSELISWLIMKQQSVHVIQMQDGSSVVSQPFTTLGCVLN